MSAQIGRSRNRKGLTLIELVMVLVILVALASLLVPQMDFLRRSADKGTASSDMKSITENIQMYRTLTNFYPNRWDSLIDDDDDTMADHFPSQSKYALDTLNANEAKSLTDVGITTIMNHDPDLQNAYRQKPGNSGIIPTAVAETVSVVTVTDPAIIRSIYPSLSDGTPNDAGVLPDGVKLVAFGLGPHNAAIGQTMQSPPAYNAMDANTQYNRYLGVFAVYDKDLLSATLNFNTRAQLKAVLDTTGDFLNQEIAEFHENSPALTNPEADPPSTP